MNINNKNTVVAFDVDGTLITYDDKPRYEVIAVYNHFLYLGCTMVIWSGGGQEYAESWANKLGLSADHIVCKFGSHSFGKPDIAFDDEIESQLGRVNIYV